MQPQADRSFSRAQYRAGRWHTTSFKRHLPPLRWLLRCVSFKYQELDRFARRGLPHEMIADLGAGIGSYARFFLQCRPEATLIAIDWSPEALRTIGVPPATAGRLWKVCADAEQLPFKPSRIDACYSIDTLGHIRHQERALDEVNRVCRSGARLFLHSECADYRTRWPDKYLIRNYGTDRVAALDGHYGIRSCAEMRMAYERRFSIDRFYSPAGILGWLTGYPEKYLPLFLGCRMYLPALPTAVFAGMRALPGFRALLRIANTLSNRVELFLGLQGGGSCFTRARTVIRHLQNSASLQAAIDVIIPTYNRPEAAGPLITSLYHQLSEQDRLFVVWQGTHPPIIPADYNRVILLHRSRPNLPAARNAVLYQSGNPIILYIDDDCTAQEGLLNAHRNAYGEERTGAVAGFVNDPFFPPEASVPSRFDPTTGELVQHFGLHMNAPSLSVMGANMSFRRTALEAIGGFDPNYRRNALWEEIDVSFRLQRAGYRIHFRCDAGVIHARHGAGGCRQDEPAMYLYHQFANTAYFACSYMPVRHLRSWLRYWKYRLEYSSRHHDRDSRASTARHRPLFIAAGMTGAIAGTLRFCISGHRIGLPVTVLNNDKRNT